MKYIDEILIKAIADKKDEYPLTPVQMGLYLACLQNPQGTMYNIPYYYKFKKNDFDKQRLIDAVKKAVDNHIGLKAKFVSSNGNPVMKLRDDFNFEVKEIKTDNIDEVLSKFVQPFDLENDLLCRASYAECGEDCYLLIDMHHLVSDGTSIAVLGKDIALAYEGKELAPEAVTMFQLSSYEEILETTDDYKKSKEYFDSVLSGIDVKTTLTEDFAEKPEDNTKPSSVIVMKSNEKYAYTPDEVDTFTRKVKSSPGTFFVAVYQYALAKFTGLDETLVCTVTHGRVSKLMANTVGMMVHTIPLYKKFDEKGTVADYLLTAKTDLRNAVENDIYPFVKLAGEHEIANDSMIVYQSDIFNEVVIDNKKLDFNFISQGNSIAKLSLMVFKHEDHYEIRFEYRSDLYREETIRSFAETYFKLIDEFLHKERLCDIDLLSDEQKAQLDKFNATEVEFDDTKTVIDLFREQAKKTPDNVAVVYKEKSFTYAQVDDITDRIAGYLSSKGIGKGDVVSVLIPRCEYMPIASIGILKSGAAYQPLDPSYPPERLAFMVKDADAKLLIADESLLELLPDYKGDILLTKNIPLLPQSNAEIAKPQPDDLFILIYTSGSTGVPKGAMLEHKNISSFCNFHIRKFGLCEDKAVSAYASYGFDACLSEMYPALVCGATVHIIEEDIRLDLVKLNKYFEDNNIYIAFMTTQVARQFATEIENHSLKYLLTGGEKLVPLEPPKNLILVNGYGPTECTVYITSQDVDKYYDRVPVGYPLDNIKLYVIDKYGRRLPAGALGELCVSGRQVSRGYLNRPEQTEKVYQKNPFDYKHGYERMYHTGDIVRFMPDGRIDFIGRNDGQVKIRGFRIELSEVEKVIREYDGITNATVIAKKLEGGGMCINAYFVADRKIEISKLNEFIAECKPPYMVPAASMQIDKIPLNVNGKVDKRKLPEITAPVKAKKESTARKLTFLEKKISGIVEKILGHNEFDISENLINAGMTSLSIIKLAVELNKTFGFEANVKQMMKGCSVASIEDELQEFMLTVATRKPQAEEKKKEHKALYPLSKTQLGVYLDCMKNPYNTLYNIPSILTFPKSFDANKLADCVKQVLKAHPYIYTSLTTENNEVEQRYVDNAEPDFPVVSLTEEKLQRSKKEFVKPHNLAKAPLFRIGIVETEKNIYLLSDFHHIVFDGASVSLFIQQLKALYEGSSIESETYTYFDYIENEIAAENGEEFKKAEKYIDNMMKNFESASEITADLRGKLEDGSLAEEFIPLDIKPYEKFCSQHGITPAHLFLAAVFYTVSRFTNNRNVYLSTISNGRSDMRLTNCFGMFVKTLALGIEVEDITSLEFVQKSKEVFTGSIENEIYPYAQLCAKYGYAPSFVYEYQLGVVDDLVINGNKIERDYLDMNTAKFKTAVHIEERNGKPYVIVQYNDALYSKELMHTLAQSVACVAENIISNPNGRIREVSMLTPDQAKQLDGFKSTMIAPVENKLLHKMFEQQVQKAPDNIAISACDGKLSYSELDRLANKTANALIDMGLKKGGRVVILLERTSKFFTSLLGILKAGGAFIPTCPDYPKERIDSIIEDSNADFVITEDELLNTYSNTVDVAKLLAFEDDSNPNVDVQPEDLAYLIYTSGSTGKPKGVMLRHIGIANYLTYSDANIQVKYVVDNCKAYGSVTTISFDMSLKETMLSLCNGLTLVFASDEQTVNPMSLAMFFKENNVDAFNATPSRLLQYMELDDFAEAMANCKVILSGGEKYPDKLLNVLREKTNARIINTYGPTEITVSSNAKELTHANQITIGKPLMNYTEYIVDCDNNLLPVGVVGELLISGCGVALGYNKLEEQTKKAFIDFKGERTYRSGDYAKWTSDGDVIILGRTDNQVKLRGLRIELGEIEKCLTSVEGIKSAIALIRKVGKTDAICAYFTADKPLDIEFVKGELKKSLTDYMVPTAYMQLDEMPLTPNGKVNTKVLPEPTSTKAEKGAEPKNELERMFCNMFAEILELDKVYADDSFFDIGGTSLTATRVVIATSKKNIDLAYSDIFENTTPQALAKYVSKEENTEQNDLENLDKFDYSEIDKVLAKNNIESFKNGEKQSLGNVLLTGPSGFLGIHILYELLHKYDSKVYCMIRDKKNNPAENRLNSMYFYYFEESLKERYADRVVVLSGDVTSRESFDKFSEFDIDTVINCAANVKHFSKGTDIEDVNLYGTLNVLDFCKQINARLIHVSTMSVGGMYVGEPGPVKQLKENQLYFGQHEGSKYTLSKFLAERAILSEVAKGFNAKIMRVGTLSARNSDGEYQINFTTNTFMGRLKSTLLIGKYPYEAMEMPFELSPIDFVAKAILLLGQSPKECVVFHPFNNHTLIMGDLYAEMDKMGLHSEPAETEDYEKALELAEQDPEKAKILSSMIAYQNMAHGQKTFTVGKSNAYTMQVLYRMGFKWPVTSLDFMKRFINALRGLGFFD